MTKWNQSKAVKLARLIGTSLMLAYPYTASAGPASDFSVTIDQPDGSAFSANIKGDEFQGWIETDTGHTVVQNTSSNYFEYAQPGPGGVLVPSGVIVAPGSMAPASSQSLMPPRNIELEAGVKQIISSAREERKSRNGFAGVWLPYPVSGDRKVLVILVNFANRARVTTASNWYSKVFDTTPGVKSVANYYKDNSFNNLTISPVAHTQGGNPAGVVTVTVAQSHPACGQSCTSTVEKAWVNAALVQAAPYVNFSALDTNGNGTLENSEAVIYLIPAGYEASGTATTPNIWAHSRTGAGVTAGGKVVPTWAMNGELNGASRQQPMGVIAHELGHQLAGLPDLYDISGGNQGLGIFSLMAGGSWGFVTGEDSGTTPTALDAWSRTYLGWSVPQTPAMDGSTVTLVDALSSSSAPVKLVNGAITTNEYFLAENRSVTGWDAGMEYKTGATGGILIQHVDITVGNSLNDGTPKDNDINNSALYAHQGVVAEEATNECTMIAPGANSRGCAGILFRSGTNADFLSGTTPSSNYWSSATSNLGLRNISAHSLSMTASVEDKFAPTLSAMSVASTNATGTTLAATSNETATGYWVVVASGAAAPSSSQVKAGNDSTGSAALQSGNAAMAATVAQNFVISGLSENIAYDIYLVASDSYSNDTAPQLISFTTGIPTGPDALAVSIPNVAMKVGDSVTATITVASSADTYTLKAGSTLGGFALGGLAKTDNTTYTASFTVAEGGADVPAGSDIPVHLTLINSGNEGSAYTTAIAQNADAIDANSPAAPALAALRVNNSGGNISVAAPPTGITAWLAPAGTTVFAPGATMTILVGNGSATAIATPTTGGAYKLYWIDAAGNVSAASANTLTVDTAAPSITNASIPNATMKIGDTVTATITVTSDTDTGYTLKAGSTIGGYALGSLSRVSDTSYTATFTISNGSADVAGGADIPTNITLTDGIGNDSAAYTTAIAQNADAIDANKPVVSSVTIPNAAMKVGDAVTATITVASDADSYTLKAGATLAGFALGGLNKSNDTTYTASFTVAEGGSDVPAGSNIPVSLILIDPAGNESAAYTSAIAQNADAIDANSPAAPTLAALTVNGTGGNTTIAAPPAGITAWLAPAGTSVFTPGATMTQLVGNGSAAAIATPTTAGAYKLYWVDAAGNISPASTNAITVDATPPTATITAAEFDPASYALTLTGTDMNTLLESGEDGTTNIKARLDWSKLTWDINGDGATSADKTFVAGDIASVLATSATTLKITLTGAAASALKAMSGYGAAGGADKVVVTAGFLRDQAGNPATTDAANPNVTILPVITAQPGEWLTADGYGKAGAASALVKFTLQSAGGQTLDTVSVKVAGITGGLQAGDIESLSLARVDSGNVLTPVGSAQTTVAIDGSSTTITVGTQSIATATTFAVVAKLKDTAPTHGAAFRLDMAAGGIGLSANSPAVTPLTSLHKWHIDTAAPTAGSVAVSAITSTFATLAATLDEAGTGYWVVLPATEGAPSVAQVKAGQDSVGATAAFKGNSAMGANSAAQLSISGLTASTGYKAYFVAADQAGNDMAAVAEVAFTTGAAAVSGGGGGGGAPAPAPAPTPIVIVALSHVETILTSATPVNAALGSILTVHAGASVSGVAITLGAPVVGVAVVSVTIKVGGNTLRVTPAGANTVVTLKNVTANGVSTQVLALRSGAVAVSAPPGQPLMIMANNGGLITTGSGGGAVRQSLNASGTATLRVISGYVLMPRNAFAEANAGANGFAAIKDGKLYAGEIAQIDADGKVTQVRLGSDDGDAASVGDPIKTPGAPGLTMNLVVPNLKGTVARVSDTQDFGDAITASLGAGYTTNGQNDNGVLGLSVSGVSANALPVGDITVDTDRADGVTTTGNGRVEVAKSGVITRFVPAVAAPAQLAGQAIALDKNATITVNDYGVLQAGVNGQTYALQPGWVVGKVSGGSAGFTADAQGHVVYQDSTGNQQTLYPAFADLAQLIVAFKGSDANLSATGNDDGTVTAKFLGKTYTLIPDYALIQVPVEHAKDAWWLDSNGKVYLKSSDGKTAQGFSVK